MAVGAVEGLVMILNFIEGSFGRSSKGVECNSFE